jgi:hypothetical protein
MARQSILTIWPYKEFVEKLLYPNLATSDNIHAWCISVVEALALQIVNLLV